MNIHATRKMYLRPYRAYSSLHRSARDYLGSLKVRQYSYFPKSVRRYADDDLDTILDIYEKSFGNTNYHQILKYPNNSEIYFTCAK